MPRKFSPNLAENKIITNFPHVRIGETIRDVEEMLVKNARTFDTVDYVYVVDKDNVLSGVLSIKEILDMRGKDVKVEDVMKRNLVVAHPFTHQERVVYLALSHNIKAVPVVDREGHLLGIIPYDTLLHIFNEEVREDTFKFGGIFHRVGKEFATIESSASLMIKHRLPWLIVGVLGGAITASIVSSFEHVLSNLLALVAFTPVLAYLSDAVGTQSETLAVRSIALNPKLSLKSYFIREFMVAIFLALICGLLLAGIALAGWHDPMLVIIVGISMFLSIIAAVFISTALPFLFMRLNWDPAFASGPFATMISDVITVTIYFSIASILLEHPSFLNL